MATQARGPHRPLPATLRWKVRPDGYHGGPPLVAPSRSSNRVGRENHLRLRAFGKRLRYSTGESVCREVVRRGNVSSGPNRCGCWHMSFHLKKPQDGSPEYTIRITLGRARSLGIARFGRITKAVEGNPGIGVAPPGGPRHPVPRSTTVSIEIRSNGEVDMHGCIVPSRLGDRENRGSAVFQNRNGIGRD